MNKEYINLLFILKSNKNSYAPLIKEVFFLIRLIFNYKDKESNLKITKFNYEICNL